MNILSRLTALEQRPQNRIPRFSVELADGGTTTAFGYGLLVVDDVQVVRYDPRQECVGGVLDLFRALCPGVEIVPN